MTTELFQTRQDEQLPAIWVADLGDYNAGILTGEWIVIDVDTTVDDIHQHISDILKQGVSVDSPHEEWIVCDYNNLPLAGSWPNFETVIAAAQIVREYGYNIAKAFIDTFGDDRLDEFEERFCGVYDSVEDYAYQFITDCYDIEKMMGSLASYFNYEAFARDLEYGGDISSTYVGNGQVVIFFNT